VQRAGEPQSLSAIHRRDVALKLDPPERPALWQVSRRAEQFFKELVEPCCEQLRSVRRLDTRCRWDSSASREHEASVTGVYGPRTGVLARLAAAEGPNIEAAKSAELLVISPVRPACLTHTIAFDALR
jgi:hypothetical protein